MYKIQLPDQLVPANVVGANAVAGEVFALPKIDTPRAIDILAKSIRSLRSMYMTCLRDALGTQPTIMDIYNKVDDNMLADGLVNLVQDKLWEDIPVHLLGVLKCSTDKWDGPIYYIGEQGFNMLFNKLTFASQIVQLQFATDLEHLPSAAVIAYNNEHFVPMWEKDMCFYLCSFLC